MTLGHATLFFAVCNNIRGHLIILGNRLKEVKLNQPFKKCREELKELIEFHQVIIGWVKQLNEIYSSPLNAMSIYYALLIGASILQIIVVN